MVKLDLYASIGCALELLAISPYHKQFEFKHYFATEILPPLQLGQCKIYLSDNGIPVGMVTWAKLKVEIEKDVLNTGRALKASEWASGNCLFCNDFIAPYENGKQIADDLKVNVFPSSSASSILRNTDGSVRKIVVWKGVELRKKATLDAQVGEVA